MNKEISHRTRCSKSLFHVQIVQSLSVRNSSSLHSQYTGHFLVTSYGNANLAKPRLCVSVQQSIPTRKSTPCSVCSVPCGSGCNRDPGTQPTPQWILPRLLSYLVMMRTIPGHKATRSRTYCQDSSVIWHNGRGPLLGSE